MYFPIKLQSYYPKNTPSEIANENLLLFGKEIVRIGLPNNGRYLIHRGFGFYEIIFIVKTGNDSDYT